MALLPNRDDVLYRGGRSFNYNFTHEKTSHTAVTTTGGASEAYDAEGIHLVAGGSAGDTAFLDLESLAQFRSGIFERTIIYQTRGTTPPYTDGYKLGYMASDVETYKQRTAFLDFENGVYSIDGNTKPATLPNNYRGCYLQIVVDTNDGTTTFVQKGDVNETATFDVANRMTSGVCHATSNGAGDVPFKIAKVSSSFIPPQ